MCRLMAGERMVSIRTLFVTTTRRTYPQRRRTMRRNSGFFLLICLLVALSAAAQNITGTLQGTVTDPQGAAVPNAQVSIKNVATGEARTVTASSQGFYTAPEFPVGTSDLTINQPTFKTFITSNLFLIDGVNNNDIGSNRTILIYPSTQAIEEFKMLRNSYGPEYGQAAGAIINIVTKSGTNSFHGGGFYRGRNTALNATDYFNSLNHIPKDVLHRNDYGFNIGGPIVKDKLFFFESEEWNKEIRGKARTAEVPTVAEKLGNFTNLRPGTFADGKTLCDPVPAGGPIVPNLSTAGLLMVQTYPDPNLSNPVNCANWGTSLGAPIPWREDNVRIDFHATSTFSVFGRFTNDSWAQPYPSTLSYWGDDIWPGVESSWAQPSRQATVKLTKLLGSTSVNDFQVSFAMNRIKITRAGNGVNGMTPTQYVQAVNIASPTYFPTSGKFFGINEGQPLFWNNGIELARRREVRWGSDVD